jgi:hypothetical protein
LPAILLALGTVSATAQSPAPALGVARYDIAPPGVVPPGDFSPRFGWSLAAADLDLDGVVTVIAGEPSWGTLPNDWFGYIGLYESAFSPDGTSIVREGAIYPPAEFVGVTTQLGTNLAIGDFDANGYPDIASWVFETPGGPIAGGGVLVFYGPIADDGTAARTQTIRMPVGRHAYFGFGLAAGDYDGDGIADLAVGQPFSSYVTLFFGATGANLSSPYGIGIVPSDQLGYGLSAFDPDGDGVSDLLIGAGHFRFGAGVAYWLPCGTRTPNPALARLITPDQTDVARFCDYMVPINLSRAGGPLDRVLFGAWDWGVDQTLPGTLVMWATNGRQRSIRQDRFGETVEVDNFGRTPAFGRIDAAGFRGAIVVCGAPREAVDGVDHVGVLNWAIRGWRDSDGSRFLFKGSLERTDPAHRQPTPDMGFGTATTVADLNGDGLVDVVASDSANRAAVVYVTGIR